MFCTTSNEIWWHAGNIKTILVYKSLFFYIEAWILSNQWMMLSLALYCVALLTSLHLPLQHWQVNDILQCFSITADSCIMCSQPVQLIKLQLYWMTTVSVNTLYTFGWPDNICIFLLITGVKYLALIPLTSLLLCAVTFNTLEEEYDW